MSTAATNQQYPTLNDFEPSWADLSTRIHLLGGPTIQNMGDFKSIKWDSAVTEGRWSGLSGGREMKRTTGIQKTQGSCEFSPGGLYRLCRELAKVAPTRGKQKLLSLVIFDIVLLYTPPWTDFIFHEEMRGCRMLKLARDAADGSEVPISPVDLAPMSCVIIDPANGEEWTLL